MILQMTPMTPQMILQIKSTVPYVIPQMNGGCS